MQLYRLGSPPSQYPLLTDSIAPFTVDGIVLTADEQLPEAEQNLLALYRRYGRPIVTSAEQAADLSRTNYRPIDCGFYDHFEAAIVQRRTVELEYLLPNGAPATKTARPLDLKTHRTEEYVLLDEDGWVRLDRIVGLDGVVAGDSCSF